MEEGAVPESLNDINNMGSASVAPNCINNACHSRRTPIPPFTSTISPTPALSQCQWSTGSPISQTKHPQVQRSASSHVTHNVSYGKPVSTLNQAVLATPPDPTLLVTAVICSAAKSDPAHWEAIKRTCHPSVTHDETSSLLEG